MKNAQTICSQKFTSRNGNATVSALRVGERLAVRICWPCGFDAAPSVKWFQTDAEAMAGYLAACGLLQTRKFQMA